VWGLTEQEEKANRAFYLQVEENLRLEESKAKPASETANVLSN